MEVAVYNKSGENTGRKVELKDSIFAIEPNDHVIYLDCKQYMANNRQGTHSSLHRGIVSALVSVASRTRSSEVEVEFLVRNQGCTTSSSTRKLRDWQESRL